MPGGVGGPLHGGDYVSHESLTSAWTVGMRDSAAPVYPQSPKPSAYSGSLRNLLFGAALFVALFPIPVTAFGLLPTYQRHARFLILYTPIICLLAVGYLFYLRDSLARLLFADLIDPREDDEGYRFATIEEGAARLGRRLRSTLVALLPALLLAVSFFCFTGYTRRFSESLELTTAVLASEGSASQPNAPADPNGSHAATRPVTPTPSRADVLRTADLDSIMMFGQLTALYIGIFVAALMAIVVMALKEHAAQAMGLSEQALLLGAWDEEEEPPDERLPEATRPADTHPVASPPVASSPTSAPPAPQRPPAQAPGSPMDLLAQEAPTGRPRRPPTPNGITPQGPGSSPPVPPPPQSPPPQAPTAHRTRYSMEPREPE